jgi:hypothetical protein
MPKAPTSTPGKLGKLGGVEIHHVADQQRLRRADCCTQ